jgi:hypothetical protein
MIKRGICAWYTPDSIAPLLGASCQQLEVTLC